MYVRTFLKKALHRKHFELTMHFTYTNTYKISHFS